MMADPQWPFEIPEWVPQELSTIVIPFMEDAFASPGVAFVNQDPRFQRLFRILTNPEMQNFWQLLENHLKAEQMKELGYVDGKLSPEWAISFLLVIMGSQTTVNLRDLEKEWKIVLDIPFKLSELAGMLVRFWPEKTDEISRISSDIMENIHGKRDAFIGAIAPKPHLVSRNRTKADVRAFIMEMHNLNIKFLKSPLPRYIAILVKVAFQTNFDAEDVRSVVRGGSKGRKST